MGSSRPLERVPKACVADAQKAVPGSTIWMFPARSDRIHVTQLSLPTTISSILPVSTGGEPLGGYGGLGGVGGEV
jgi:hypothetical protein